MSAIGAGAKELPRQRGGLGRGYYRPSKERSGGWVRPVYSKVYTMAPIRARGEKTGVPRGPGLRGWDIGTNPPQSAGNGHWWQRRPLGIILPPSPLGSKSSQRLP